MALMMFGIRHRRDVVNEVLLQRRCQRVKLASVHDRFRYRQRLGEVLPRPRRRIQRPRPLQAAVGGISAASKPVHPLGAERPPPLQATVGGSSAASKAVRPDSTQRPCPLEATVGRISEVETPLPGCRNALGKSEHRKTRANAIFGPHPGDPLHAEPFWATRQQATTRGEATFWRGCPGPAFLWTGSGRTLETLLPGCKNALGTSEH